MQGLCVFDFLKYKHLMIDVLLTFDRQKAKYNGGHLIFLTINLFQLHYLLFDYHVMKQAMFAVIVMIWVGQFLLSV